MAKKRPEVLRKEKERLARLASQRKTALAAVSVLGIKKGFEKLPKTVRDSILSKRNAKPDVFFMLDSKDNRNAPHVAAEIMQFLHSPYSRKHAPDESDQPDITMGSLTPSDFFSVILPIGRELSTRPVSAAETSNTKQLSELLTELADAATPVGSKLGRAIWRDLMFALLRACSNGCRMNDGYFTFSITRVRAVKDGKPVVIRVSYHAPESIKVELEPKKWRTVWRAGWTAYHEMEWFSIDASLLGGQEGKKYPIYVQEHVFERLSERLHKFGSNVQYFLSRSLENPHITEVQDHPIYGRQYLLDYVLADSKVGYIILCVKDEMAIAVTFKFITMLGVPEGEQLARRLRMGKRMMEWHGLHDIESFLKSDLFDDPIVARWFNECGLGGLDRLRKVLKIDGNTAYAEQFKKSLRIDARREALILEHMGITNENENES